jgi:hypothetical protein
MSARRGCRRDAGTVPAVSTLGVLDVLDVIAIAASCTPARERDVSTDAHAVKKS